MEKFIVFVCLAWSSMYLNAQITVPNTTFPVVGDKLKYAEAANPGIAVSLFTPPGFNQNWDLSALISATTFETNYRSASSGTNAAEFPGATMVVINGGDEYYYRSTTTKFEQLGSTSKTLGGVSLKYIYVNRPAIAERHAPLNFFDIYQQSSSNLQVWGYKDIPAGPISLPVIPDSVRMRISKQVIETVDASGTLKLPGTAAQSQFPVLRLKKTTYKEQRIDAKIPPLGWIDVTDNIVKSGGQWSNLLGVDTILTHHYYNNVSKEEIAVLTFNNQQNAVVKVVYKNTLISSPVVEVPIASLYRIQVYPNPAVSSVKISCSDMPPGVYTFKIFNSLGIIVKESIHQLAENIPIEVYLPPDMSGLHFLRLEDVKGNLAGTSRLMVIPE